MPYRGKNAFRALHALRGWATFTHANGAAVRFRSSNFNGDRAFLLRSPPAWSVVPVQVPTVSINISSNGVHDETAEPTMALAHVPVLAEVPQPSSHTSVDLPIAAKLVWPVISDLYRFDRWLTFHDAWDSEVPFEPIAGADLVERVTLAGWTGTVTWTIKDCEPPSRLRLSGTGLRGADVTLELTIEPIGYWSRVIAEMEFTGYAATGAAGVVLELGAARELESSLANLEQLVTR